MIETDGTLFGTFIHTTAIIIAFIRIENNGRLPLFLIGDHDIHEADIDASVAAGADIGVNDNRTTRGRCVGNGIGGIFHRMILLLIAV
jgi:hypothetical protein